MNAYPKAPVVTLKNGTRVANFSSPHPFTFDDGTTLEACPPERVDALKLIIEETEMPSGVGKWVNIILSITMGMVVIEELGRLDMDRDVDIVLVPYMLREKLSGLPLSHRPGLKTRCIRKVDRSSNLVSSTRFCL